MSADTPEMKSIADQVFEAQHALSVAEDRFCEAAESILNGQIWDWTWDWYDRSFELHGVPVGEVLTDEQRAAFGALGFVQCWLNYVDGTERHYACNEKPSRSEVKPGRGPRESVRALATVIEQGSERGDRERRAGLRARAALERIIESLRKVGEV